MSLHNGIDTVSYISRGVYSENYGVGEEGNIANLYASFGLFEDAPELTIVAIFSDGDLLIRQPFSEDYLLSGTTLILRLPWLKDYEIQNTDRDKFIRKSLSEDYEFQAQTIRRLSFSEDYENDEFYFIRLPFSKDYKVEAK